MRILILTTYFPPDTAIAAVRPYMFAKYLERMGHDVVVVRSGRILNGIDAQTYPVEDLNAKVISYLGDDAPAELVRRGAAVPNPRNRRRLSFIPRRPRTILLAVYHFVNRPRAIAHRFKGANDAFRAQRECLDGLREDGYSFDVVFATYGELENVYGGRYAAELYGARFILDFRDLLAHPAICSAPELILMRQVQRKAVLSADVCTGVSSGLVEDLRRCAPEQDFVVINNGYEPDDELAAGIEPESDVLTFCYTGYLYANRSDATPLFKALAELVDEGEISADRVRIYYAGPDGHEFRWRAESCGVAQAVVDRGYVKRSEARALQAASDVFVVLSWNRRQERGILTGKFYEGIRCGRPILVMVSGEQPDSELKRMNERYNYGFCYEEATGAADYPSLKEWVLDAYRTKRAGHSLPYTASSDFSRDFRYDTLTKKLDAVMRGIV